MLISDSLLEALNRQVGREFAASLQYVAIAAHFSGETLPELARHFNKQAAEEREHATKFIQFILDVGGKLKIPAIPAPECHFSFAEEAVKLSLEQEKEVTRQIHELVQMARSESDYTTENFLQWFVEEQLEEISSMEDLLRIVQRAGEGGLLRVEEYLSRKGGLGGTNPEEH